MAGEKARGLDAAFLLVEEPATPMHVGGMMVLEPSAPASASAGPVTVTALRRLVGSRLSLFPRFAEVPSSSPLSGVRWVARRPVLREHIRRVSLSSRRWSSLLAVAAEFHAAPLPRSRPLWEMLLVDGLEGGRQALLVKTHHAITDGLAGVRVMSVLTSGASVEAVAFGAPPAPPSALGAALGAAWFAAGGPIALPGPFNGRVGPRRVLATAQIPVSVALAAKRRLGARLDDVFLAAIAVGVRRHLLARGVEPSRALRTMVPVSLRSGGGDGIGNRVSALFVDLPVCEGSAEECLRRIVSSKTVLRRTHEAVALDSVFQLASVVPLPLTSAVSRLVAALPVANLIASDIPGPREPVFLLGHRVSAAYPFMPLMREVGLSLAALSMDQSINLCLTADPALVPGVEGMCASIASAFETLALPVRAARAVSGNSHKGGKAVRLSA